MTDPPQARATFLDLPPRSSKPRTVGLTHVIDTGIPVPTLDGGLAAAADFVDLWKFGFGTAYLDPTVAEKVALLADHGVTACIGGTLLEVAWTQDRVEQCLAWAARVGFGCVEVSNGAVGMPGEEKRRLVKRAAVDFTVLAEVGSKDANVPVDAAAWSDELQADLEAGAAYVLAEGRASGTVGLFAPDGSVHTDLVERLASAVGVDRLVFEAPRAAQQAWFVRRFGSEVNVGNVAPQQVLGLEALRLGLRADTIGGPVMP
jgi:phosphosulfolactate synthase